MRVARLWRHLKLLKRAGIGHDPAGVAAAKDGSCAVECPACPHPDVCPRDTIRAYDSGIRKVEGDLR